MEKATPQEIKAARARAGLTLAQSAALVGVSVRAWQFWESGQRAMPIAAWKLYNMQVSHRTQDILIQPAPPQE